MEIFISNDTEGYLALSAANAYGIPSYCIDSDPLTAQQGYPYPLLKTYKDGVLPKSYRNDFKRLFPQENSRRQIALRSLLSNKDANSLARETCKDFYHPNHAYFQKPYRGYNYDFLSEGMTNEIFDFLEPKDASNPNASYQGLQRIKFRKEYLPVELFMRLHENHVLVQRSMSAFRENALYRRSVPSGKYESKDKIVMTVGRAHLVEEKNASYKDLKCLFTEKKVSACRIFFFPLKEFPPYSLGIYSLRDSNSRRFLLAALRNANFMNKSEIDTIMGDPDNYIIVM